MEGLHLNSSLWTAWKLVDHILFYQIVNAASSTSTPAYIDERSFSDHPSFPYQNSMWIAYSRSIMFAYFRMLIQLSSCFIHIIVDPSNFGLFCAVIIHQLVSIPMEYIDLSRSFSWSWNIHTIFASFAAKRMIETMRDVAYNYRWYFFSNVKPNKFSPLFLCTILHLRITRFFG